MSATAMNDYTGAGKFATARRGGLTRDEIHQIEALRAKDRPEPWQALAKRFQRPEAEIRAVVDGMDTTRVPTFDPVQPSRPPLKRPWQECRRSTADSFWTEERVGELVRLYLVEDKSLSETADIMRCTRAAVIGKAHRMGLPKKPPGRKARLAA